MNNLEIEKVFKETLEECFELQDALKYIENFKKQLSAIEFVTLKTKVNTHFIKLTEPGKENSFLKKRKFLNRKEFSFPKFKFICRDLNLFAGAPATLIGESGGSKTAIASLLALCVATGSDFLGFPTSKGKVVWLDYEQGSDLVESKFIRLMNGHNLDPEDGYFSCAYPSKKIDSEGAYEELVEATRGIDFAIIDCLRGSTSIDENDSHARDPLDLLREVSEETKCTFLVIHHSGKKNQEEGRGSSALKDAVSTSLVVTKEINNKTKERSYKLTNPKTRTSEFVGIEYIFKDSGKMIPEIGMTEAVEIIPFKNDSKMTLIQSKIYNFLTGGKLTGTDLYKHVGGNKSTYLNELKDLLNKDIIGCFEEGKSNFYYIKKEKCGEMDYNGNMVEEIK